jgi:superfamily I DNA/RNA helicase
VAERDRDDFVAAVLAHPSRKKLVVGGPGTGKTYLFKQYLKGRAGRNLVLTFINNLVGDLDKALGANAKVQTFHSYCKGLLHKLPVGGITPKFDYYPPISLLVSADIAIVRGGLDPDKVRWDLENDLRTLTDSVALQEFLEYANYYDAVGHDDGVYRVVRYLRGRPDFDFELEQLVVDEVQDFNALEMALIELIAKRVPTLAAGDDDQALYLGKRASPGYIRSMASSGEYAVFSLPYCSRCPEVVVQAATDVIKRAIANGNLAGRIAKDYLCHWPSKSADSERYPKVIVARCSISTKAAPYMAKYVLGQIQSIPADDLAESWADGYPSALVIGPRHFLPQVYDMLRKQLGSNVSFSQSKESSIELVDGYTRILTNSASKLGWRIILHGDPCVNRNALLVRALRGNEDLASLLPTDYAEKHRGNAALIGRLKDGDTLAEEESKAITSLVGMDLESLKRKLGVLPEEAEPAMDQSLPRIVVTTLLGAKGLSAGHVFTVGMIDGHFPRQPNKVTDDEVCKFIVALTRTRKQCHLVTSRRYAAGRVKLSQFIGWISAGRLKWLEVDKAYFGSAPK